MYGYDHLEHVKDVLQRRIRQLDARGIIKLNEYAAVLLDGDPHLFLERQLFEHRNPGNPKALQAQPRQSDGIEHHIALKRGVRPETDEELIELLLACGGSLTKLATKLGVARHTVAAWVGSIDPELKGELPPKNTGGRPTGVQGTQSPAERSEDTPVEP